MTEIRLQIIKDDEKTVHIHVTDADATLKAIEEGGTPLKFAAPDIAEAVNAVLTNCSDAEKIELTPAGGTYHKATGEKVSFTL